MPSLGISKAQKRKLNLIAFHNNCTIIELLNDFIDYEYRMMMNETKNVEPEIVSVLNTLKPWLSNKKNK